MNLSKDGKVVMFRSAANIAESNDRYVHACADCGSNRVYIDITLDWSFEYQAWVAHSDELNVGVHSEECKCAECGSGEIVQLTLPPDWRKQP